MSGFDILLQAADRQSNDADNNNNIGGTTEVVALTNDSQAASLYTNYISSSSSSNNNLQPKKRIKLTNNNNYSNTCSIDGLSTIISNTTNNNTTATANTNSTHTNNTTSSSSSTSTLKKTTSWNNSTYIQFRTTNNLNNNWDNDSMSVSTIGMRSVSSYHGEKRGGSGSSFRLLPRSSSLLYSSTSKKNEVWNTFSSTDSPTFISNDNTINKLRRVGLRREGGRDEGGLHQLYNLNLVIPTSKKQRKQSTRKLYKRGFDREVGKGGSSCTDVNGIEMGMGYFSSSLSTASRSFTTLSSADLQEQRGEKKRPRTEVEVVPQDELSTHEEEVPRDSSATSTEDVQDGTITEEAHQDSLTLCSNRPQEEEGSAIVVNLSHHIPPSKLNNNGIMNENARVLIAKSQLYQAYLQALNNHQD